MHTILVTSTRRHITLSYRSQFYVGVSEAERPPLPLVSEKIGSELSSAACYHPDIPSSILLSANRMESPAPNPFRFLLTIPSDSLGLAGINEQTSQVQLEYGICTFSRSGRAIGFWQTAVNRNLTATELSGILDAGFKVRFDLPHSRDTAMTRLVVLGPKSGNLGTIDLVTEARRAKRELDAPEPNRLQPVALDDDEGEQVGSRRSLGSVVPAPGALCGDVYELPTTTSFLPSDFRALNAIGAVFTDSFDIPEQILRQGLPGSTARSEWFGVDYYGEFWVSKSGRYEFVLNADDGADLYIDDRMVINNDGIHPPRTVNGLVTLDAGRHTMHLPYFEGPTYVSLILQIKPPDGDLSVFDIRNYARPAHQRPPGDK